jgi:hypothetical protein
VDETGPADALVTEPAAQRFLLAAHEGAQLAANDFDVPERLTPKFDLSFEGMNVPHCRGQNDKASEAKLKTAERRFNGPHSSFSLRNKRHNQVLQYLTNELIYRIISRLPYRQLNPLRKRGTFKIFIKLLSWAFCCVCYLPSGILSGWLRFHPSPPKLTSVVFADEVTPDQIAIWRTQ